MRVSSVSISQALRGALRLLLRRDEAAPVCSFCGQGSDTGRSIIAGPGVAICDQCAYASLSIAAGHGDGSIPPGLRAIDIMVFADPMCLLPAYRPSLAADIAQVAARVDCAVVGWSFNCGSQTGDYLAVRLACHEGASDAQICARFIGAYLSA